MKKIGIVLLVVALILVIVGFYRLFTYGAAISAIHATAFFVLGGALFQSGIITILSSIFIKLYRRKNKD